MHNLGFMYENGYGVPRDFVQAHKLYSLPRHHAIQTANGICATCQ
ncbi:MAG: SEL1-like repeat protein [Alphaproteobacteria bacterium]|nr:SEL1-like repeat protein [Alphaproteobacteria bacterium]